MLSWTDITIVSESSTIPMATRTSVALISRSFCCQARPEVVELSQEVTEKAETTPSFREGGDRRSLVETHRKLVLEEETDTTTSISR